LVLAGEFRPYQEVDVHAKIAGYVKAIFVDYGDRVKAGQMLAILEIPELAQEVERDEAGVKMSQAEIARAEGDLARAESVYHVAHLAYNRLAEVSKTQPGLIAQQELDDAQGRDSVAEAQVASANAGLAGSRQALAAAEANKKKTEVLFKYSRIVAPFSGVITKRYADTGAMIQAGTASESQAMPVVKISQNDPLRLDIPVPESAVPNIHIDAPVKVEVATIHKTFGGKVARFANRLDFSTRTMMAEIDVPNPKLEIVPGMYAEVSVAAESRKSVLTVPIQALNREGSRATVFRVTADNKLELEPVIVGLETSDRVEIESGLNENDLVVVGGRNQLRAGETVTPKLANAPAKTGSF
jgi:RND family efflux transporter MFP subunit